MLACAVGAAVLAVLAWPAAEPDRLRVAVDGAIAGASAQTQGSHRLTVAPSAAFPWSAVCADGPCGEPPDAMLAEPAIDQPPELRWPADTPLPWADAPDLWALDPQPVAPVTGPNRGRVNMPTIPDDLDPTPGVESSESEIADSTDGQFAEPEGLV
ncbi:MAG: hypothetical protein H6933_04345 [Burkholderiaceae bacterium]|nr:hypothetical protein [Rhodoferax sp.]MCP5284109.1 hypothetical protein [Burkholderiaceae bacterium]